MAEESSSHWQCPNQTCQTEVPGIALVCPKCQTKRPENTTDKGNGADPSSAPVPPELENGARRHAQPAHVTKTNAQTTDVHAKNDNGGSSQQQQPTPQPNPPGQQDGTDAQERHRAAVQEKTEQRRKQFQDATFKTCEKCGKLSEIDSNFCSKCGTPFPNPAAKHSTQPPNSLADDGGNVHSAGPISELEQKDCYFCRTKLNISNSGEKSCPQCRRPQPQPVGPPCIHLCGVNLINPDVKVCARCGKPQTRATTQPTAEPHLDSPASQAGYNTGYGYSNNSPQFDSHAQVHGLSHSSSGHADGSGLHGASNITTNKSLPHGGKSPYPPSSSHQSNNTGHPATAQKIGQSGEVSTSESGENSLTFPIQETGPNTSSAASQLQTAEQHPLKANDNGDVESGNDRKRKISSDSDTNSNRKQNKLDNNKDVDDVASSEEETNKLKVATTTTGAAVTTTALSTAAISTATNSITTTVTTSTSTSTSVEKPQPGQPPTETSNQKEFEYRKPLEAKPLLQPQAKKKDKKGQRAPAINFSGLEAPPEKSFQLTFHVMIPKTYWEWDSKSSVHIRFGHPKLGEWSDCGNFQEIRNFGDGIYEMECTFRNVDVEILKRPLPYKYVVHSPKADKDQNCYEFLHAYSSNRNEFNRCLVVPPEHCIVPGVYHKIDAIAYPKSTKISKSYWNTFLSTVTFGILGKSKEKSKENEDIESFSPLGHQEMMDYCLERYLLKYKEMLCSGCIPEGFDIHSVSKDICSVYNSLCVEKICPISDPLSWLRVHDVQVAHTDFKEKLRSWFESIITSLASDNDISPSKRLVSATCVTYCISMPTVSVLYAKQDPQKFLLPLAGMLTLQLGDATKTEYEILCTFIQYPRRAVVADAISKLCARLSGRLVKHFAFEWLLALPLYHLLSGRSELGGKTQMDLEIDWYHYNKFGLQDIKAKARNENHFVERFYDSLKGYFSFDPTLLKIFAYLTPKDNFVALCERVPPYLSTEVLFNRALNRVHPEDETWSKDIECLKCAYEYGLVHYSSTPYLSAMVKSSLRLCEKLSENLRSDDTKHVKLLGSAISCVLCAIQNAHALYESDGGKSDRRQALDKLQSILKIWITHEKVIGGSVFGHSVPTYRLRSQSSNWKGKQELMIWQSLLSIPVPDEYHTLKDWHNIVKNMVYGRIHDVSAERMKIELVTMMEKITNIHPLLEGIIMDAALKAVDSLMTNPQKFHKQQINIELLAKEESEHVGKLLGRIFDKHYPNLSCEPTLEELFEWNNWPRFINICECRPRLKQGLSRNCVEACQYAKTTVLSLCGRFKTGQISVNEFQIVHRNKDQIPQLFQACSEVNNMNLVSLKHVIKEREEEFNLFCWQQTVLNHLYRYISGQSQVNGLSMLQGELNKDYGERNLCELCTRDSDTKQVLLICFKSAGTLVEFAESFYILSHKHGSDIFATAWNKSMLSAVRNNPDLVVNDIYPLVWQPCLKELKQLLMSLSELSMRLDDVDKNFNHHKDNLDTQLAALFRGIIECTSEPFDLRLIERAIERIRQYWELCRYRRGAQIFLKIRESLELEGGDFGLVEKLSKEMSTSGDSQTLHDVDDNLICAGEFLEDIAKEPRKVECLDTFARCKDIVKWLKDETKDVNEIQHFVNVALATAAGGEGDLSHDKLSHLRTVGNGFASLIYNFPQDAGFIELKEACTYVWEALNKNENLPKLLEGCNKAIGWYQGVKETQGSVEVTSYGQMRNILKYGCFQVGTSVQSKPVHRIHDLISLKLNVRDKQLSKTTYNLDELRDLESKLVLITGSKAENRTEVDHYLNVLQHVTRIAEVLLALRHAGNVAYSERVVAIRCATYTQEASNMTEEPQLLEESAAQHVAELNASAKEMENALEEWENEVKKSRSHYYELNYYTTLQLLRLRRELGQMRNNTDKQIDPEILALLHSISLEVNSDNVSHVLNEIEKQRIDLQCAAKLVQSNEETNEDDNNSESGQQLLPNSIVTEDKPETDDDPLPISRNFTKSEDFTDKPKLTKEELSDIQNEILTDLVEYQGYSKLLVLKAFEECSESANAFDIQVWCTQHEYLKFEEDEETDASISDSSSESSSSDEEEGSIFLQDSKQNTSSSSHNKVEQKSSPVALSPKVKVVHRQIINESHPVVQQLVEEYEYDLEPSIEAVRQSGGNLEGAMNYLARLDTEDGDEILAELEPIVDANLVRETADEGDSIVVYDDDEVEGRFLSLDELGAVLRRLSETLPESVTRKRTFVDELKTGSLNLVVTHPGDVLKIVLTLYMEDEDLPLPTLEEVLICNSSTTAEDVILLWQRAVNDPGFKRIFCLVHAEKLSYQICDRVVEALKELTQGRQDYRLVIVCSKEGEDKSHIVSKLLLHKKSIPLKHSDKKCQRYLRVHFSDNGISTQAIPIKASVVDHENSSVRVVSSKRTGMGKSLYITRMAEKLGDKRNESTEAVKVVVPIHGPIVTSDIIMTFLKEHYKDDKCKIYHFDIAPSILSEVDTILFSLLILQGLSDSHGRVWRCHPAQLYAVEVTVLEKMEAESKVLPEARTMDLLNLLPTTECISPTKAVDTTTPGPSEVAMDSKEFGNPTFQRVYQYLRRHTGGVNLDRFKYEGKMEGTPADSLKMFLESCGVQNPSWSEIYHFVKFLDLQLESCENSVFCDESLVGDVMSGLKGFVVKFMITMSRDFATPSLRGETARGNLEQQAQPGGILAQYEIEHRRRWEESSHPYIFFNNDGVSITFVGFIINTNGDLIDPRRTILVPRIMTKQLYTGLIRQGVNFSDDYRNWKKPAMIEKLSLVMGVDYPHDPDETYVLTVDNLIKMLAIQMRFRCGIPVVIMGETGCGKTRLIRYMCDLAREGREGRNMLIMKIHGGTKEKDIIEFMATAEKQAKKNKEKNKDTEEEAKKKKMDTVVFFDEANTTDAIGLIKEIMCDRRIHGRPVSEDLKFIAACNPYRRHSDTMIKTLESAGLGFRVRASETQQKLGKIPLRQLVYRVLELPPSMKPLVYDFGQLKKGTEDDYIQQIVHDHVKKHPSMPQIIVPVVTGVLAASQAYMRNKEDECSFVSLRDVERAMIVFEYFYEKIDDFRNADKKLAVPQLVEEVEDPKNQHPNNITSALILAVSVCYHARLQDRKEYEERVSQKFAAPLALPGGAAQFRNEITWCQNVLLDNMELGQNIAKNAALRENVFMMAICIELRIPLFLVGKPGSSKSLAKSIIQDSMHGKTSRSDLLKKFKQVHMFSYQCSQLATPESVIEVFKSAKRFQSTQDTTQYVSVVVLDEVGLAEDSPNLPLKALHPLLEDGTEGAGMEGKDEVIDRNLRVAFIGISNWALDPAKMNRGVMVTRGTPDIRELRFSAKGICGEEENDNAKTKLEPYFEHLAEAYETICKKQKREFFGLRDFYSLIKMLYWMCKKSKGLRLTWPQMKHAIMRNFGGLKSEKWDPFEVFRMKLNLPEEYLNREDYDEEIWPLINPDCSRLGLIKTSLDTKETSFHGENRYLLFLTENYAALDILEHYIRGKKHDKFEPDMTELGDQTSTTHSSKPFTIFGSSFPRDKEYTQVCRNINQIKICMETGRTVILLNLENLYESLYDVLNQYYMHYGDNRYVDLGLQTHRVKCRVHKNFKLILIAERETVYEKFPTPLINRLEKHFVLTSSVLKDWQQDVLDKFQDWIGEFSKVRGSSGCEKFGESYAFIGYQKDTPAAVVFQASRQLKRLRKGTHSKLDYRHDSSILGDIHLEELVSERKGSNLWKLAVLRLSQFLLLQIASDDALVRLKKTALAYKQEEYMQLYFIEQHHDSIVDFVRHHIQSGDGTHEGLLMQVTTHGHLLIREELDKVGESINMKVEAFLLQEFDTELDFSNKVGPLFHREKEDDHSCLLVIQCDSGHINGDLIACARYRIYDERVKAINQNKIQGRGGVTHILFIINLPHQVSSSSFIGFQGDPWISAHIDDLKSTSNDSIEPQQALRTTISELFIGDYLENIQPLLDTQHPHRQVSETGSEESSDSLDNDSKPHRQVSETGSEESSDSLDNNSKPMSTSPDVEQHLDQVEYESEIDEETQQLPVHMEIDEDLNEAQPLNQDSADPTIALHPEVFPKQNNNISAENELLSNTEQKAQQDPNLAVHHDETVEIQSGLEVADIEEAENVLAAGEHDYPVPEVHLVPSSTDTEFPKSKLKPHVTAGLHPVAQCKRLYGCIQAAASKLDDSNKDRSTQRVTRLTKLIPRDPTHFDPYSFYGVLVMHLYKLLKEREEDRPDLSEWVLNEALNASKLEVGGTFRNVLARKIDEVVIPIFAKIIACIDSNYNLDLIDPKMQDSPLSMLWLAIFGEPKVLRLRYSDMVQGDKVPGVGGRKSNEDFRCQMPFFWFIKDAIDSQCGIAKSRSGTDLKSQHNQLCDFIQTTPIGAVLERVDIEHCEIFYEFYLHDFVRSVHKCKYRKAEHENTEYQLVSNALSHLVNSPEFDHESLISRIAALHLAFENNKSHILWFGQLISHFPSIMESLKEIETAADSPEMELHLFAAVKVMEKLEPPLKKDNPNPNLTEWLNYIRRSQNAITSILSLKSSSEMAQQARYCWQRLRGTQLFVEHVMLKHPDIDLKLPARRLSGLWKGNSDFQKVITMQSVQLQLNGMEKALKKASVDKSKIKEVKKSCRDFFMELVSDLCFGGKVAPEPNLIKMLLDNVFVKESTQELTPYKDDKADKIPTIRSFILQLLLEHSMDQVRDHLKEYLDRSYRVLSGKQDKIDQNLFLLIIQCFEDSLAKRFSCEDLLVRAREATTLLREGFYDLQVKYHGTPSLEFLEGVAKIRYSLSVVVEVIKNDEKGLQFMELLKAAGQMCSDREINCIDPTGKKDTVGPVVYLLKLMVRQYGMPFLKAAAEVHEWIIPAQLRSKEDKTVDPFVVYGNSYKGLRESVSGAMYGQQLEELHKHAQNLQPHEVVYLLLSLYEKATLSRTSTNPTMRISGDALGSLNDFVMDNKLLSNELRFMARALLANKQGGRVLEQMSVSPRQPLQCRTILGVVVHTAAVFFGRQKVDVLLPFVNILSNPAALNRAYFPTMTEDQLVATQAAMRASDPRGKFYECPRGHRRSKVHSTFQSLKCGGVVEAKVCYICHAPIGGENYTLKQGNKLASLQDATKVGHDLGAPQNRTETSPERELSARAVCILRTLIHSAFIWSSCNNDAAAGAIAGLVSPPVPPQQLPEFFWAHLEKDLDLLGRDTGKGLEENVMIVHLVLRQILTSKPPMDGTVQTVSTLGTKEARKNWEKIFNQHYIQPVLNNLNQNLATSMDMVANDEKQNHDQLFYLVYEKTRCREETLEPHLWTYRSRITFEHLRQSLHDKKKKENYPLLSAFLQSEADLRATQYLPDIARLQRCLYDKFNHQIDKKDSKRQTIGDFIKDLPNETVKNEYREMIDSFKAAWVLVGHKLKNHSPCPVEEKYYIATIDDTTPMEFLVPTTSEAGVCTTSLVHFLYLTHNDFIERCRGLVAKNDQSSIGLSFWREHKVPIYHLHRCHLVDYEHQLPSIILSHCHYSLKVGKGEEVKYDHQALERHILNRFIHGKPIIMIDIPQVVYRKDIYTTGTFTDVRQKVSPQERLPQRLRQDIISELRTPDRLRQALDVVEIVLGFLSSGGGKADKSLGEYIDKTLKMRKRNFSQKAKMACQLKHVLSLWETIAVELARQLCLRGQEPFDSIRQEFLCELSETEIAAVHCCLGHFDPDLLLGTLYEFIETYVKHATQQEQEESLVVTLDDVLYQYGLNLPKIDKFPDGIKLKQTVAAWKHIVRYYARKH